MTQTKHHCPDLSNSGGSPTADNTEAVQAAIDAAAAQAGGVAFLPPGDWPCGALRLRSGVTLHVSEGATLRALGDPALYPFISHDTPSRMDCYPWRAFLFGDDLENVTLTGGGVINGGGRHGAWQGGPSNDPNRPYAIHLVNCRGVRIENLRLRDSAFWMLRLLECEDVTVSGLEVFNHANLNSDGIDIDSCRKVRVTNCHVDASDDAICLKSEGAGACEDIVVADCTAASRASALKLGTGSIGGFRNVTISRCVVRPSRATEMTHELGFWKGMTGLDVGCVDGGDTENIHFADIDIEGVENPVFVKLGCRHDTAFQPATRDPKDRRDNGIRTKGPGSIRGLCFERIRVRDAGPWPVILVGVEDNPLRGVCLRDVEIQQGRAPDPARVAVEPDITPEAYPSACHIAAMNKSDFPVYGLFEAFTEGTVLDGFRVFPHPEDPRPEKLRLP